MASDSAAEPQRLAVVKTVSFIDASPAEQNGAKTSGPSKPGLVEEEEHKMRGNKKTVPVKPTEAPPSPPASANQHWHRFC